MRHVLQHGQFNRTRQGDAAAQEACDCAETLAFGSADQGYWRAELQGELLGIHFTAALREVVGHVEEDQCGQAEAEDGGGQRQVAAQVGGVHHQHNGVGAPQAGHLAVEHIVGDALVL